MYLVLICISSITNMVKPFYMSLLIMFSSVFRPLVSVSGKQARFPVPLQITGTTHPVLMRKTKDRSF